MDLHTKIERFFNENNIDFGGVILSTDAIINYIIRSISENRISMSAEYDSIKTDSYKKEIEYQQDDFSFTVEVVARIKWEIEERTHDYPGSCDATILELHVSLSDISFGDFESRLVLSHKDEDKLVNFIKELVDA